MKKLFVGILMVMVMVGFGGCAGKFSYNPPIHINYNNSIIIEGNKNDIWKKLIFKISNTFFVINNIDKESGLINISYNGDPCMYIDCGNMSSKVTNLRGTRNYNFLGCQKSTRYEVMNPETLTLYKLDRSIELDGRANVFVQNIEDNKVMIRVNVRYIVSKSTKLYGLNVSRWELINTLNDKISFNSNGTGRFPGGKDFLGTLCIPNGNFEKEILGIFKE